LALEVGIDVGGTFTDLTFFEPDTGKLWVEKVSTSADVAGGEIEGLADIDLADLTRLTHGSTVALNAILQRAGASVGYVTTRGFKDHIEIGDTRRYTGGLHNHRWQREQPYPVPHERRYEVDERTLATGEVAKPLDEDGLRAVAADLRASEVDAVAVCFLNSYLNDVNERRAGEILREELPDVAVCLSSVNPEFREYPRFITAVFNAYVAPLVHDKIESLEREVSARGYDQGVVYMTSSGGIVSQSVIDREPMLLLFGSVAGGVAAGAHIAGLTGMQDAVTLDMGGTSTDVGLIKGAASKIGRERVLVAFPIAMPTVDVVSIGAGGGSIGWVDVDGSLKVGPRSAGAQPGPASYGRGGTEFTVTDANLLLGRLGPDSLLSGEMTLDVEAAMAAAERLAEAVGIPDPYDLAEGVVDICNANMRGAVREVSIERGENPEELGLIAFGGAGGLHAIPMAERLGMRSVIVPRDAGTFSALGMLVSDARHDYVRPYIKPLTETDVSEVVALFDEMRDEGREALLAEGISEDRHVFIHNIAMRYLSQAFEEEIAVTDLSFSKEDLGELFREAYFRRYGFKREAESSELVSVRLTAVGQLDKPSLADANGNGRVNTAPKVARKVRFAGEFVECEVFDRSTLQQGVEIAGPAVVEEHVSTTVIFPGWSGSPDGFHNLVLSRTVDG
jgi:N-methylhydantoinase A